MNAGQVSWITGASSGIGEAVAKKLAGQGHRLILSARRVSELERVKAECVAHGAAGDDIHLLVLDVLDYDALSAKVDAAFKLFGRVDLLLNNAGISQRSMALETPLHVHRKLFEVDVFAQIALTTETLNRMLEQGDGHIAVTSSVTAKLGVRQRSGYSAAKHAIQGYYDTLRVELADENIRITTILPGFVSTNISKFALTATGEETGEIDPKSAAGMSPETAADIIFSGMQKGQDEIYVTSNGENKLVFYKRFFPERCFKALQSIG